MSTVVQHRLEPPGHGLNQVDELLAIVHLQGPQPFDLNLQLQNGGCLAILQLGLHPGPAVLDGTEIRGIARPVNEDNVWPLMEPLGDDLGAVARVTFASQPPPTTTAVTQWSII